ncbi:hypothetical protein OUZ56_016361 [Daphnia magna]|uniref:Uncharacterized protein n=1 Tax=Daphnia magna TaxID=35525 RepID=A0ABR0AQE9_9CRUS|nr:hypothetical protein OUZ56_016361 [Daphnia magna]
MWRYHAEFVNQHNSHLRPSLLVLRIMVWRIVLNTEDEGSVERTMRIVATLEETHITVDDTEYHFLGKSLKHLINLAWSAPWCLGVKFITDFKDSVTNKQEQHYLFQVRESIGTVDVLQRAAPIRNALWYSLLSAQRCDGSVRLGKFFNKISVSVPSLRTSSGAWLSIAFARGRTKADNSPLMLSPLVDNLTPDRSFTKPTWKLYLRGVGGAQ